MKLSATIADICCEVIIVEKADSVVVAELKRRGLWRFVYDKAKVGTSLSLQDNRGSNTHIFKWYGRPGDTGWLWFLAKNISVKAGGGR